MAFLNLEARQIKGLLPALDGRVVKEPFILDGRNFLLDLQGPQSYFYSKILNYDKIYDPINTRSFRIGDLNKNIPIDSFIMTTGAVLKFDAITGRIFPVYTFADDGTQWPWSMATCGNDYYFARRGIDGIIHYNTIEKSWELLTDANIGYTWNTVLAVTQANGRLVILTLDRICWSAQDVGTDLTPSLVTGAGFQGLSIIGGSGLGVFEVADGFITLTTQGAVKSETTFFITGTPFRHYVLDRTCVPVTAFSACNIQDRTVLVLDAKGLYSSTGAKFQALDILFNEYISSKLLNTLDTTVRTSFKLEYNDSFKTLFVSIGSQITLGLSEYAFALYLPRNEWGRFDNLHSGFCELFFTSGVNYGFNYGFIDEHGYIRKFLTDPIFEVSPENQNPKPANLQFHLASAEIPATICDGITRFRTVALLNDYNPSLCLFGTDYYTLSGGIIPTAMAPYVFANAPFNSYIIPGLFRYQEQQFDDEMGSVTNVALGVDKQIGSLTSEDWLTAADQVEDFMTSVLPDEDWGDGVPSGSQFTATIVGTNDAGETVFADNEQTLVYADQTSSTWFGTCDTVGIWHTIKLATVNPGDNYHLKSLQLSGIVVGRL